MMPLALQQVRPAGSQNEHLKKASERSKAVRKHRTDLKDYIRKGGTDLAQFIDASELSTMRLYDIIELIVIGEGPRIAKIRTSLFEEAGTSQIATCGW